MYAIKGGWVGQTFALAPCNESGGRKARIRRSKEERKSMVESFIQKYQSLNDGKFPSLNITHKEVGGSFYTVREIVRDIIQENRVLGPAKFSSENQKSNGSTRGYPRESATMESQDYLFQLEIENPVFLDQQAIDIMELNVNGNGQYANAGKFDGSNAAEKSDKLDSVESLLTESVGGNGLNGEPVFVGVSTDFHGNTSMELNFQNNEQLDKHEDLEVENLVNGSPVEGEFDKMVSTESSVREIFQVKEGAGFGASTGCPEKAKLELRFSDIGQRNKHEGLHFGKYVNDTEVDKSDKLQCVESSLIEKHEVDSNSGSVEPNTNKSSITTEDVVVETFPMRSVTKDIYTLDTTLHDSRGLSGELEEECLNLGNGGAVKDKMDTFVNAFEPIVQKAVNGEPIMAHETTTNDAKNLLEIEDPPRIGKTRDIDTRDHNKPAVESHNRVAVLKTIDERQTRTGAKARNHQNTVCPNNFYGAKTGHGSNNAIELTAENQVMVVGANEVQKENQAPEESKQTLNRINLGSWEGASKKSSEQERNPFLHFVKSLVSAFRNFLSE